MNGNIGATLDIRVLTAGNQAALIRVDQNGITIMSPGNLQIYSAQGMTISSDADININCENLMLQGRLHQLGTGGSS